MIVDDQPTFREAARMLLTARGYHVVAEASSAATALDAVERHAPQAVLLDIRLGDDDGYAVCDLLTRSRPELAVVLASADEPEDSDLITRCGARGFVPKLAFPTSTSRSSGLETDHVLRSVEQIAAPAGVRRRPGPHPDRMMRPVRGSGDRMAPRQLEPDSGGGAISVQRPMRAVAMGPRVAAHKEAA